MSRPDDNLDPYERIVKKTLDKFIPFKVDWEITYACNLNCRHCYQLAADKRRELSRAEAYSVLDQLADLGCLYITFSGGEILTRNDFFEIAGYAQRKGFAIRLFTNATLIDEEAADRIQRLNPLSVEISLYAADAAVHDGITGSSGSFEKSVNALELLKKRNLNTVVKCTFIKDNLSQFDGLKGFADSMGCRFTYSFTLIPKIDGTKDITGLRLEEGQAKELFCAHPQIIRDIKEGGVYTYKPLCAAGFNSLYISPYGEVFPCVVLREDCGNLREASLKKIWHADFFRRLRSIEYKDLKQCAGCGLSHYCDRCAGLAWLEGGDLLGPSVNDCLLARARKFALEAKRQGVIKLGRYNGKKEKESLFQAADSIREKD
jgi:radical SAM protein with 4Fe4S-binding SPASM domain